LWFWVLLLVVIPYLIQRFLSNILVPGWKLRGKGVLITGCDTGFGYLTALRLSQQGNLKVLAGCLTAQGVEELKSKGNPEFLTPFLMDVTNQKSVDDTFELVKREIPIDGMWAIINNAGVLRGGLLEIMLMEDWRLMFDVNVFGMTRVIKKFIPLLRKCKDSRVVNIASVAGRTAPSGLAGYSASKHAVEGLSESLRKELRPWGINVTIIEPGIMKTPLYSQPISQTVDNIWGTLSAEQRDVYGRDYFAKQHDNAQNLITHVGGDPNQVVESLVLAVNSGFPPHRIAVGKDAPIWLLISYLPSWLADLVFRVLDYSVPLPIALKRR